jgi:pilus assembly protein CpaB
MNKRFLLLLVIAALLALLAAWFANRLIKNKEAGSKSATVSVVVAATEIPFGTKLEESQVKIVSWPEKMVPQGSYKETKEVVGSVTLNKFYPEELITEKRISKHLGGSTLSALITKNYRALSVRVDDVVGVSGFVLPGNKIDVLTTKMDRITQKATTKTLLQNVKVLAVDQEASRENEKPAIVKAVTLEVTQEQAELIVQAMQEGTIQLTLRNPLDSNVEFKSEKKPEVTPTPVEQPPPPQVQEVSKPIEKKPVKKRVLKVIPWS